MTNRLEEINNFMKPYTYHIYHQTTNQHYYGAKYSRDADPVQLWKTYFTSSSEIKYLIEKYGADSFEVTVRKVFETPDQAVLWETKFLTRIDAKNRSNWLNRHNGDGNFSSYGNMPASQRQAISEAKKGKPSRGSGWKHSPETIEKIRQGNKGKHNGPKSKEHRDKISNGMKARLEEMSLEERKQRVKNSCCAPETYTKERSENISKALKGKNKSKDHKRNLSKSIKESIKCMTEEEKKQRFGKQKGRTWRIIDGKRKWVDKENKNDEEA